MNTEKYYKKYLKYKSKYYYLKYGGAGADENPLTYPPADRTYLIEVIQKDPHFFKKIKDQYKNRGNKGVLMSGQTWGEDPNRYTTEFLQHIVWQMRRTLRLTGEDKTPKISTGLLPKPTERETLINTIKIWKYLFESEAKKAYEKGEDILEPGQQFGNDPNRFKTEFLRRISKKIDSYERADSGWSIEINEALKKDPNYEY